LPELLGDFGGGTDTLVVFHIDRAVFGARLINGIVLEIKDYFLDIFFIRM
jgi:hypothetical protein